MHRRLALVKQLGFNLKDRAVNIVLGLVYPLALALNIRCVNIGPHPSEEPRYGRQRVQQASYAREPSFLACLPPRSASGSRLRSFLLPEQRPLDPSKFFFLVPEFSQDLSCFLRLAQALARGVGETREGSDFLVVKMAKKLKKPPNYMDNFLLNLFRMQRRGVLAMAPDVPQAGRAARKTRSRSGQRHSLQAEARCVTRSPGLVPGLFIWR
jgi:hypothetical protein